MYCELSSQEKLSSKAHEPLEPLKKVIAVGIMLPVKEPAKNLNLILLLLFANDLVSAILEV